MWLCHVAQPPAGRGVCLSQQAEGAGLGAESVEEDNAQYIREHNAGWRESAEEISVSAYPFTR